MEATSTSLQNTIPPKPCVFEKLQLPLVPRCILLRPTSRAIDLNETSLEALMENIETCCKLLSLKVEYLSQPASLALLSEEYISMCLSLWNTGDHEATVEVQEFSGDRDISKEYTYKLLQAAHGEFPDILHKVTNPSSLKEIQQGWHDHVKPTDVLDEVYDELMSNRLVCQHSALEMMLMCSYPQKTRIAVSVLFSRVMLMGTIAPGTKNKRASEMQMRILEIILYRGMKGVAPSKDLKIHSDDDGFKPTVMCHLFNVALTVLERCLEVATTFEPFELEIAALTHDKFVSKLVDDFLGHARVSTSVDLIETLLDQLENAHNNPHNARVAASCLRCMCAMSQGALQQTQLLYSKATLEAAHKVGESSHAKLEWECKQLQAVLEPSC